MEQIILILVLAAVSVILWRLMAKHLDDDSDEDDRRVTSSDSGRKP